MWNGILKFVIGDMTSRYIDVADAFSNEGQSIPLYVYILCMHLRVESDRECSICSYR